MKARYPVNQRPAVAMEIQDERALLARRKVPGDERFSVIRLKTQLFNAAHTCFGGMREAAVRENT